MFGNVDDLLWFGCHSGKKDLLQWVMKERPSSEVFGCIGVVGGLKLVHKIQVDEQCRHPCEPTGAGAHAITQH